MYVSETKRRNCDLPSDEETDSSYLYTEERIYTECAWQSPVVDHGISALVAACTRAL